MKKIYFFITLLMLLLVPASLIQAQELMVNGDLEQWDDPTTPTGWDKAESINQAASPIHGGDYSAQHTSSPDGTQDLQQNVTGIIGGANYTISYWYFDFSTEAKTRVWAYWLDGTTTLDDNGDVLRPSTYSQNSMEWQQFSVNLTAPPNANGFRFEVRAYHENNLTGGVVYYDDFSVMGAGVMPEPTNYPTDFAAEAEGVSINLSWADAIGDQLPNGYLIKAATVAKMTPPIDGVAEENDLDLSDGYGALNVAYGQEACSFGNLDGNTTYYFVIYPYTNAAADIDYKNDGIAPQVSATTADINVVLSQNFDAGFGNWQIVSVVGDQLWEIDPDHGVNNSPCAKMNGYSGGSVENEDWLISPAMDLTTFAVITLNYMTAMNYAGPELEVLLSVDYDGGGDPTTGQWETLAGTLSGGNWVWTAAGDVDLSTFAEAAVYLAFKYTSTSSESSTWEVDDVMIIGGGVNPEPSEYPGDFDASGLGGGIGLEWTDAAGSQLPSGYIIIGSDEDNITAPIDGTPIANDDDLSDGSGALNIAFGVETCNFSGLSANETFYFAIYPYTNAGINIDYKTDATAPTSSATTVDVVTILEEGFENGWGEWQQVNLVGDEAWELGDLYPEFGSYYAKMTGFDGSSSNENEDWLISPSMDFDNFEDEILTFQSASNYSGPGPDILIATSYDGEDPYSGNWETIECDLSPGGWDWTSSGEIDVSDYDGQAVYIAFVYTSTSNESATWEFDEIKVTGVGEIGIDEEEAFSAEVNIYPNPANDRININSSTEETLTYRVYSIVGSPVSEEVSFKGSSTLDCSHLSSGIYLVRLSDESGNNKIVKLIVER